MLDGLGIATTDTDNEEDTNNKTFAELVFLDSTQDVQESFNSSSNVLLYPRGISQNFLPSDTVRVANVVFRRPSLFSSRYHNDVNNEFNKYERRVKRRFVPNTRVISSSVYRNEQPFLAWDRSPGSGSENSTLQQWYRPLTVSNNLI